MRKLSALLAALMIVATAGAQNLINPNSTRTQTVDLRQEQLHQRQLEQADFSQNVSIAAPSGLDPVGTVYSDQITAFKIGESRNAFSFIAGRDKQVSVVPGVGTNGGSVSFIYRHNVDVCGGVQPSDNGRYRYSISTDGGQSWDVGGGVTVSDGNPAPVGHCFGKGEINPTYTRFSRYPNMAMFVDPTAANPTTADLNLVYVGPVLLGSSGWDGHVLGSVTDIAGTPIVEQEIYMHQSGDQYLPASLIERVPGEFWYVANTGNDALGDNINVNKGVWDATTKEITWSTVTTIVPNHYVFEGGTVVGIPHIAFSPDGQTGFIAHPGDLVGGEDTTISPIFYESTDGGATWSNGYEFNLNSCSELRDTLLSQLVLDSIGPGNIDTVPFLTGKATIVFTFELAVDANGNPHYFTYVAGASSPFNTDGSAAGYFFYPGIITMMYDITKDSYGDWNMMHIASQSTYDASFGDFAGTTGSEYINNGPKPEVSRTADGNYVFFNWQDSDTTLASYSAQTGPDGSTETNTSPELKTRAFDVQAQKLTATVDRTAGDANFGARSLLQRPSYIALEEADTLTVPTVIMDLVPGTSTLNPVSYVYLSDVTWNKSSDFTIDPTFCYNCKENPYANSVTEIKPDCGVSDGELSVSVSGGIGPYTTTWSTGATSASVTGLSAGLYSVSVEDSKGCIEEISYTLNNANAPVPTVGAVADISCNGANDGTATVTVTGGAGSETYSWDNGETGATATMLPVGTTVVEITDANGCQSFTSVTIAEPDPISIDISAVAVSCAEEGDGSASALAVGGTGMLSYSWSNGATTATISGLSGDVYTVTVTDANGCTETAQISVDEPAAITVSLSASPNTGSAAAPNGTASASASGGTSPFTYDWVAPDGTTFNNAPFIFGLCEGDYAVTVTDAVGCITMDTVEVTAIGDGCSGGGDAIEDELAAGLQTMLLLPNPNNGSFNLRLELDRPEDLSIEIFNINGQLMVREELSRVVAHDQAFQLQNVSSGIYLVKVTTSRGSATQKVVIR